MCFIMLWYKLPSKISVTEAKSGNEKSKEHAKGFENVIEAIIQKKVDIIEPDL